MLRAAWNAFWAKYKAVPCDGPGIDSYDTEHTPLEQRVIRLEKGRVEDFDFLADYIDNLKERIEKLEG
jgi:hypothetical protein